LVCRRDATDGRKVGKSTTPFGGGRNRHHQLTIALQGDGEGG